MYISYTCTNISYTLDSSRMIHIPYSVHALLVSLYLMNVLLSVRVYFDFQHISTQPKPKHVLRSFLAPSLHQVVALFTAWQNHNSTDFSLPNQYIDLSFLCMIIYISTVCRYLSNSNYSKCQLFLPDLEIIRFAIV